MQNQSLLISNQVIKNKQQYTYNNNNKCTNQSKNQWVTDTTSNGILMSFPPRRANSPPARTLKLLVTASGYGQWGVRMLSIEIQNTKDYFYLYFVTYSWMYDLLHHSVARILLMRPIKWYGHMMRMSEETIPIKAYTETMTGKKA